MKQLITTLLLSCALGAQAQHVMTVNVSRPTAKIQPTMYGIFFEDINFGADGGLYAELVKNRSFEFPQPFVGWVPFGNVTVQDAEPCFDRNPHYASSTTAVGCVPGSTTKVSVASASSKARNTVSLPMPALPMLAP